MTETCAWCRKPFGWVNCPVVREGEWVCLRCRVEEEDRNKKTPEE